MARPATFRSCGDFDGDGIADLALFRNGVWYLDTNRDGIADMTIVFGGVAGEIPVVLDYDGDGRADIGVFRSGIWYINTNLDGASAILVGYGAAGDVPLAGYFNRAKTRFVKAGSGCVSGCTQANPYGTITSAWQDAVDGDILRIAKGTYAENLDFSYPGNQYLPGKFGKNNIKLIGVSKYATIVSPTAGDALYLRGASGYVVRGLKIASLASGARGLVMAGGFNSVLPAFPGAQVNVSLSDLMENDQQNALLTGASNAWFRYVRLNRSRAGHGLSAWGNSYVRVVASEISSNGYTVPPGPPVPDAGKGFDIRDDSEGDARRTTLHANLTYGVVSVIHSVVRLTLDTIDSTGYNGVNVCGVATTPDTSIIYMTNNWIANNGFAAAAAPGSGMEIYLTCSGAQTLTGNTFIGNALNGLFVGSGTATLTNNVFQSNTIGFTLYAGRPPCGRRCGRPTNGSSAWPVSSRTRRGCRRRRCGDGWCNCWGGWRRAATTTGEPSVRAGLKQFLKVTRSYWPGLFRCYDAADLPRTNNDLEHTFGSHRYHERRSSGRRRASPGLVVMGSARVISGLATRLRPEEGLVLRPGYVEGWQELRAKLEARREARRKQRRFRHDPAAYLAKLEQQCLQLTLPP